MLDHSLPEHDGYSFRSHAILKELTFLGVDVAAITGPKHPADVEIEDIEGIRYERTPSTGRPLRSQVLSQLDTIWRTRRHVARRLRGHAFDVVHAHSPCLNGLAALWQRAPFLYEMRSSWEDAAVSFGVTAEGSPRYRASRAVETFVAKQADEVVVISEGLKSALMDRGVAQSKITIVPNALPAEMFEVSGDEQRSVVKLRYGLQNAKVIGYFGSFFEWEGLDLLIEAMKDVVEAVPEARLVLAGGGRQERHLRELIHANGLDRVVILAGRIPHEEVRAFYGVADLMAYPRKAHRLTEMVTPLKPLEAMAQGIPVVASNVGGHREQINDRDNGFLFPAGDSDALASIVIRILQRQEDTEGVVRRARQKVTREHRWSVVAERYLPLYKRLMRQRGAAKSIA